MIEPSDITVEPAAGGGRYVYRFDDGAAAELLFHERTAGLVAITYVEVPSPRRGGGVGEIMVRRAVEDARAAGKTVMPLCSFARRVCRAHAGEWADSLVGM